MKELDELILHTSLEELTRNMRELIALGDITLREYEVRSSVGVWIAANCLITAEVIMASSLKVALLAARREKRHIRGVFIQPDETAQETWSELIKVWTDSCWLGQHKNISWPFPIWTGVPYEIMRDLDEALWKIMERKNSNLEGLEEEELEKILEQRWQARDGLADWVDIQIDKEESLIARDQSPEEAADQWFDIVEKSIKGSQPKAAAIQEDNRSGVLEKPQGEQPPAAGAVSGEATAMNQNPWELIPDSNWDKLAVRMWWEGYSNSEIAGNVPVAPRRVTNRLSELRQQYGENIVPTYSQLRIQGRKKS